MSEVCCKCTCHCTNEPTGNQNDNVSKKAVFENPVYSSITELGKTNEILDRMNLNPKLLKGVKENGCEHVVASMDPSTLDPESGNHVLLPNYTDTIISLCVAVLQQIDCSLKQCQAIIMSSCDELSSYTNEIMQELGKHMIGDSKPHSLCTRINKKYVKGYKLGSPTALIMEGTPRFILSFISKTKINLNDVKIVAYNARYRGFPSKYDYFHPEVWKFLPRDVRIFTTSDHLMNSLKKMFETPAKKMKRDPTLQAVPVPLNEETKRKKEKMEKDAQTQAQKKTNSNQGESSNAIMNSGYNKRAEKIVHLEFKKRVEKKKLLEFKKRIVSDTGNAESVKSSACKEIKIEGVVIDTNNTQSIKRIVSDTGNAESVESSACKKIKIEGIVIDTSNTLSIKRIVSDTGNAKSVESSACKKIKIEGVAIDTSNTQSIKSQVPKKIKEEPLD